MSARGALCVALAAASLAGCTVRTQGRPLPAAQASPARPLAARAELHYRYEGDPWEGPPSWDERARLELEASGLLAADAPDRTLRLELSRVHTTPVWRYVVHWLTLFCAPRVSELTLEVRAALLDPAGAELAEARVSSSVESSASLLWLFWPPAYAHPWTTSLHDHPLVLENVRGLTAAALSELAADAPDAEPDAEPGAEPEPASPPSACPRCETPLEPGWKHCPQCGDPVPGAE